ncbi:MAG: NAD(P)-dependent oxidoreductase [Actinobacteria bacterium]|nr:NAD(P)-dependent oxidoreductase [Actinomycetota bacterium]
MANPSIGFIGLGRLGSAVATVLLEAGHPILCCARGRSEDLVAKGAQIAGDGTARAVAEATEIVFTCLPGDRLGSAFDGPDGILAAPSPPVVVELSTADLDEKQRLHERLAAGGGALLDCPLSGTPAMAAARAAVIFASGRPEAYERVAAILAEVSPGVAYVGALGAGTRMKYVANLLVIVHVTAAAEAMALAEQLDLDLDDVVELLSRSPAATSGQFQVRAPMIAAGEFEGRLVTADNARENLSLIVGAAEEAGASVPLASTARDLLERMCEAGDAEADPAKLALFLGQGKEAIDG